MDFQRIFTYVSAWCADNHAHMPLKVRKGVAKKIKRDFDDSYLTITHSDPTGELAVRNVMRQLAM